MSEAFDPYHKWLGIPPAQQPPNHYRLLGIDALEADQEVIDVAANRQMAYLQDLSSGPNVDKAQKLLNEISAARRCLLNAESKTAYDQELKTQLAASQPAAAAAPAFDFIQEPETSFAVKTKSRSKSKSGHKTKAKTKSDDAEESDGEQADEEAARPRRLAVPMPWIVAGSAIVFLLVVALVFAIQSSNDGSGPSSNGTDDRRATLIVNWNSDERQTGFVMIDGETIYDAKSGNFPDTPMLEIKLDPGSHTIIFERDGVREISFDHRFNDREIVRCKLQWRNVGR